MKPDNSTKLEAELNAIFTSGTARNAGRFTKKLGDDTNPLSPILITPTARA